jgi:ATP-binding cassette subfamily C protein LapB
VEKKFLHLKKLQGAIEFDQVCFQYPGQEGVALDKVSFKITSGERVAFIGRVGSGKSTVTRLLLGLYKPLSGSIRVDGIDINQIDPVDLRKQIGYVSQDSVLFYGTIRDNIAIGMPTAEDAAIMEAAKMAGADSFIHRHPSGYGMHVGEKGEGLSGGQRQTIAIARALLADPSVWLFDEPTSSMDNSSENELIQRLATHLLGKTVLLVTHRTALFPLVDRIIVMDSGHMVMDGPKDKVIAALSQPIKGPSS